MYLIYFNKLGAYIRLLFRYVIYFNKLGTRELFIAFVIDHKIPAYLKIARGTEIALRIPQLLSWPWNFNINSIPSIISY